MLNTIYAGQWDILQPGYIIITLNNIVTYFSILQDYHIKDSFQSSIPQGCQRDHTIKPTLSVRPSYF